MKTIICSQNIMRDDFTDLCIAEGGEKIKTINPNTGLFHTISAEKGKYYINHWMNRQNSIDSYKKVSKKRAEYFMSLEHENAIYEMNSYLF